MLAVAGRSAPERTRVFLLTLFVIDDLVALGVIAFNYSAHVNPWPVAVAAICYILLLAALKAGADVLISYLGFGLLIWLAMLASGIDPLVTGLVLGLTAAAYSPDRSSLENAFGAFRRYREQPSSELAGQAVSGLTATLSPNARLQKLLHPWAGYVVVPLFALANAGVVLTGPSLERALTSPFMWSIVAAYLLGKPLGVLLASAAVAWVGRAKITMPVGWASVMGSGTVAGTAFTVSLLIATLAFTGEQLKQAQIAILLTVLGSMVTTSLVFRVTNLMEPMRRARALQATPRCCSTSPFPLTCSATMCAARWTRWSRSWSTATSNARAADAPRLRCAPALSARMCVSCGGTCPSRRCTPTRPSPRRQQRPRRCRESSGPSMTCCCAIRTSSVSMT